MYLDSKYIYRNGDTLCTFDTACTPLTWWVWTPPVYRPPTRLAIRVNMATVMAPERHFILECVKRAAIISFFILGQEQENL